MSASSLPTGQPDPWAGAPLVTAELPGAGGSIRATPEDFEVEESPAYQPCGEGSHLFLWVEKRGRNTREVASEIARALKVAERDVGIAGQKDRQALTRQFMSVPNAPGRQASGLAGEGWRVLSAKAHGNKLKTGHLLGNRFRIRVRGATAGAAERARATGQALAERGLPNLFGPQRFGRGGSNVPLGRALVLGGEDPQLARARRDRFLRRIAVSAYQSWLFNRVLAERVRDGLFASAVPGDLMKKLTTGGLFTCESAQADGPRVAAFEISPTGPMFGHRMMSPQFDALAREERVLAEEGLTLDRFAPLGPDAEGTRRPMRLPLSLAVSDADDAAGTFVLEFSLPKGSFATAVLREVLKSEVPEELPEEKGD
ncbi:MAG: tRNA pseudouridine(13) synthase TruD [Myxococcales bacterium]